MVINLIINIIRINLNVINGFIYRLSTWKNIYNFIFIFRNFIIIAGIV